jgi:hypothetical protein
MWKAFDHYPGLGGFDPVTMTVATVAAARCRRRHASWAAMLRRRPGKASADAQYFKAAQEDQAAQESRAASQRTALEKDRQATLLQSTLQANAAASGGGAADPTVVGLGQDIAGRGEYQSLMDMYTGENRARGIEDQAIGSRMTGDAAARGRQGKAERFVSVGRWDADRLGRVGLQDL